VTGRLEHPAKLARLAGYWRRRDRPDVAETIEADLVAAGRCRKCGRSLSDPVSIAAGIGPECASKEEPVTDPRARRARATRDAIRSERQADSQPHRVEPYLPDPGFPFTWRARCTKPGCRWTWDGIGRFEHFQAEHEALNHNA
jgi:hypothetical protein